MTNERPTTRLEIRRRSVLAGDGGCQTEVSVFCPVREYSVPTETCAKCPRLQSMERDGQSGAVVCEGKRTARANPCDVVEAAARAPVGAFMRRAVLATRDDAGIETLARLFVEHNLECLPVVDGEGGVTGMVTKSDLLRASADAPPPSALEPPAELGQGFHVETVPAATARDIMTPGVYCLPEDARLSHAIALMAAEKIAHVPIVGLNGALVGVVSEHDVVQWLAEQLGYDVHGHRTGSNS